MYALYTNMKNLAFLSNNRPFGPEAGSVPPETAGSDPLAIIYILKRGRSRLKETPLFRRGPKMKTMCIWRFLSF